MNPAAGAIDPPYRLTIAGRGGAHRRAGGDPMHPSADEDLPDSLRALARRGIERRYPKGMLLIHEGDQGSSLFIIRTGRLRAFGTGSAGREITYGIYGPGEYLGEMSLDGGPRSASVITLEASLCIMVTRDALLAHIAAQPDFALELLSKVIRRARAATLTAKQLALNDVYGRLTTLLDSMAVPQANGRRLIAERLTHQAVAQRLGCSREMVSRLLRDLQRGGFLQALPDGWSIAAKLPARW